MKEAEQFSNPDRPATYQEYVAERGDALQAEDLFHYFNRELSHASLELARLTRMITELGLPVHEQAELLDLAKEIDTRHGDLQTIALDSIRMLQKAQKQQG